MGNRPKPRRTGPRGRPLPPGRSARGFAGRMPETSLSFGDYDSRLTFDANARKSCTECNAPVEWVDEATMRERSDMPIDEAAEAFGVPTSQLTFWVCSNCDNAGVMGPAQGF